MKKLIPFILLFIAVNAFSQKEANFWYFGNGAALDFNSGTPIPVSNSELSTTEGCSSFSDINGNLLFYVGAPSPAARNLTIWGKDNIPMPNGRGLEGDASSSQSALTIPAPGQPNIYYLFTVGASSSNNAGFWYYTIDMTANGGLGDVVAGPVVLGNSANHSSWTEKVTAVRAGCDAFWVISSVRNTFYAYKVDPSGVNVSSPVLSTINGYSTDDRRGYLKVSPDGKKLVAANMGSGTYLFNFDDTTGIVSNFNDSATINQLNLDNRNGYGVEFSPTSSRLYVSTGDFSGDTEHLFQFNLTPPTFQEINNSRFTVHQYNNTRGALQLGPDGKIYWTSDESNSISVINNPDELRTAVNYSHLSVNLGAGVNATQGLPPFISSLFLTVDIKDDDTDLVINNQNLQFCIGDNKTITPDEVTGQTPPTYKWEFDNGTTTIEIPSSAPNYSLELTNLQTSDNGKYTLTIELVSDCGAVTQYVGTFNVGVFIPATANPAPEIMPFCDLDGNGLNEFNLQLYNDEMRGATSSAADYDVVYYITEEDAIDGINPLPNPYTNSAPFSTDLIFAKVQNKNAPNACFAITSFSLIVTGRPVARVPTYRICDNDDDGNDTNGKVDTFLLSTKDAFIYGNLDPLKYTISYHDTAMGAATNDAATIIDKNTNYSVTNSKQVFIRLENNDNVACNDTSKSFFLRVDPLPVLKPTPTLEHCVSVSNPNPSVNLTLAQYHVSETPGVRFEYYTDAGGVNRIGNFTSYPVLVNQSQSVFVKVITNQGCTRDLVELIINVGETPDNPYNDLQPPVCDDFLDRLGRDRPGFNDDTDRITGFYLDKTEILNRINAPINTIVTFYHNISDRANSLDSITDISDFRNNINKNNVSITPEGIEFPVYYKILSEINNNCQGLGQFYLQVREVPVAQPVLDLVFCDDILNGGSATDGKNSDINLRDLVPTILGSTQTEADYIVTFHTSKEDADNPANTGIANDTAYTNTPQTGFTEGEISEQTIYVRVQDRNRDPQCLNTHISFKIIVNPLPQISTTIPDIAVCDVDANPRDRVSTGIDLTVNSAAILNGRTNHLVQYFNTQDDATNGTRAIIDPTNFESDPSNPNYTPPINFNTDAPSTQTVFVAVLNQNGNGCSSVASSFQILLYPEANIPVNISDYSECDNKTDSDEDDENERNGDISLINKIPEILANYDPSEHDDFTVTFHVNPKDAQTGNNPIDENKYENTTNNQQIYVRVENTKNTPINCAYTRLSFSINIKPLPSFIVVGEENIEDPIFLCFNDLPLTLEAENPGATYSYEWMDQAGTVLGTNRTLDVVIGGKYTITATDQFPSGCARTRTIVVKESDIATLEENFIVIIDESNNIGNKENISIFINTTDNNIGPGNYQFAIRNDDTNYTSPFQDEPLFENLMGGIYTVIINDKNGCSPDTELQISVIQFPKFFTPNGDGKNDTWAIKGANKDFYPNSSINIFNRFGKLVAQLPIDSNGWDGTYGGKLLPSDDYWFNVVLNPANINKQPVLKKGNFSLLRR